MGYVAVAHLFVAAIQTAAIVALLVLIRRRARVERALGERAEGLRLIWDRAPGVTGTARHREYSVP